MMSRLLSDGFDKRLRQARTDGGQSIRGLAAAAELSQETVRLLQNGGRWPGIDTVERLATALNITPQWLAYGAQPKDTTMDTQTFGLWNDGEHITSCGGDAVERSIGMADAIKWLNGGTERRVKTNGRFFDSAAELKQHYGIE